MTSTTFAEAYARGYHKTVRFLVATGVPVDRAHDAAQAGWARGWERLDQLKEPQSLLPWINRISLNTFRNWAREERSVSEERDVPSRERTSPATLDVQRCLGQLSRKERELLLAYYMEGYSSSDLGRRYGCSPGALRVRVFRAKKRFVGALSAAA
jgi:RNA polymerase sigma-70 factor (ECF subfamily)